MVTPDNQEGYVAARRQTYSFLVLRMVMGKLELNLKSCSLVGTEDTHHTSTALDGALGEIYMQQGFYVSSHVETA